MEVGEEGWGRRGVRSGDCRVSGVRLIQVIVVARLFEKVEKVLAWDVFEEKKQKGGSFEGPVQSNDVGVETK